MDQKIKNYLSRIGRRGGKKSKRKLSSEVAKTMVKVREARKAFRNFYTQCFWSYDENYVVKACDIAWVIEHLQKYGNRKAWHVAEVLCR